MKAASCDRTPRGFSSTNFEYTNLTDISDVGNDEYVLAIADESRGRTGRHGVDRRQNCTRFSFCGISMMSV
jgi:hypothetical protein